MSYSTIDITEVGPAEYPLIAVLRDSIFGEFKHRFGASFADQIDGRRDVLALLAHLEGNPVAYKVGYQDRPGQYYSWTGGVLRDYRRSGVARRMQAWQHGWLRSRGYKSVAFNSFNKFRPMLQLGLSSGFLPTGFGVRPENEAWIQFTKDLTLPDPPRRERVAAAEVRQVESVGPNYHGLIAELAMASGNDATEADVDRLMAGRDAVALVAFVGNRPVGFVTGRGEADGGAYVSVLGGVLPEWRDRGVGATLLGHLHKRAMAFGYSMLRCEARRDDVPLIRAALNAGFELNGMTFDSRQRVGSVRLELSGEPSASE
jgi:GNAT superfamily N-acetyltransferase